MAHALRAKGGQDGVSPLSLARPTQDGDDAPEVPPERDTDFPFDFRGHSHSSYFYFSHGSRQIVALTPSQHSKPNLMQLASIDFWRDKFSYTPTDSDGKPSGPRRLALDNAVDWMIENSHRKGIYDPNLIRGRGAWWDDGRCVMHVGDRLMVDGRTMALPSIQSRYIYEAGSSLGVRDCAPLAASEAAKFAKLCERLNWEKAIHARLLAGWCVCALISGALEWRPHTFVTGSAGTGKTWVMNKIVGSVLEGLAVHCASNTSEAGLRQTLFGDALPVVFDDTDPDDKQGAQRLQNVLGLIRASSSDGRSRIIKGSGNGQAHLYDIRSCFICSAINVPITKEADNSRITVLSIIKSDLPQSDSQSRFNSIQSDAATLLTDSYCREFQARAINMIPVIRANARIFAAAAAQVLGTQRLGDQMGALLSGAYSLFSDHPITVSEAEAWVRKQDWGDEAKKQAETDEQACLRFIREAMLTLDGGNKRAVWEMVRAASHDDDEIRKHAQIVLRRVGIAVIAKPAEEGEPITREVRVSNTSFGISRMLAETPWGHNHSITLLRLPGAMKGSGQRFGSSPDRFVGIPLGVFVGDV